MAFAAPSINASRTSATLSATLARTPLFTSVAILSLVFGNWGRNLHFLASGCRSPEAASLPGDSGQLVAVREVVPAMTRAYPSVPVNIQHFFYWRDHARAFRSMAALRSDRATLTGGGELVQIDVVETTADLFRVLGVNMSQGRGLPARRGSARTKQRSDYHRLCQAPPLPCCP